MATGLYTLADLTAVDWTKIRPGLRTVLNRLNNARDVNIFDWSIQGVSIFPWIPAPGAALGLWYQHADGGIYTLYESDLPWSWNGTQYIDFVVKLVKSPYVIKIGQIGEAWGMPFFLQKNIRLRSAQEFIDRAYTPPQAIQPSPTPTPSPTPGSTPSPTYEPIVGVPPEQIPGFGPVAWEQYAVWGVIGLAGVIVLMALLSRSRAQPKPVRAKKGRRKGGKR